MSMDFLHYLYVKADDCNTRLRGLPRVAISWPLWTAVVLFMPLDWIGSIWRVYVFFAVAYLVIYLFVLAVYPPKLVNKNYGKWKKYNETSSLWFYLYLMSPFVFLVIRCYVFQY